MPKMTNELLYHLFSDVESYAEFLNGMRLRTYQAEAGAALYRAALNGGGNFSVMFPRQSGKNALEAQLDPGELQRRFYKQLRYCRIESSSDDGKLIKWGVSDGARDPETGDLIHDNLVMSAALAALDDVEMNCGDSVFSTVAYPENYPGKEDGLPMMTISGTYIHPDGTPIRSGWNQN